MYIKNAKGNDQLNSNEREQKGFKKSLFFIMHEIMEAVSVSNITFNCLLLIEAMQIISPGINTENEFVWDSSYINYILKPFEYVHFDKALRTDQKIIGIIILYVTFVINLLTLV